MRKENLELETQKNHTKFITEFGKEKELQYRFERNFSINNFSIDFKGSIQYWKHCKY